ncbi:MAG: hypothetical protein WBQ86_24855, partial [Candidatus Binatus sp.]
LMLGTLWLTGRCFKERLGMAVQVRAESANESDGSAVGIHVEPPEKFCLIAFRRRTSIRDDAVYTERLGTVLKQGKDLMIKRAQAFDSVGDFLSRTYERIAERLPVLRKITQLGFLNLGDVANRRIIRVRASYVGNNIGWPYAEIFEVNLEFMGQHAIDELRLRTFDSRNQQERPINVQCTFRRPVQFASDADQQIAKHGHRQSRGSYYEIEEGLRLNRPDPFPNLPQDARVIIAIFSNFIGAGLSVWGIYRGWGLFDSRRRGRCFGVGMCLLGCLISLLGQALAWPR